MTSNCNNTEITKKITYNINIMAPSSLDSFHLLIAIKTTTAISIMKSKDTEQKRPELLTFAAAPRFIALSINHGRGSLRKKRTTCYFEQNNCLKLSKKPLTWLSCFELLVKQKEFKLRLLKHYFHKTQAFCCLVLDL